MDILSLQMDAYKRYTGKSLGWSKTSKSQVRTSVSCLPHVPCFPSPSCPHRSLVDVRNGAKTEGRVLGRFLCNAVAAALINWQPGEFRRSGLGRSSRTTPGKRGAGPGTCGKFVSSGSSHICSRDHNSRARHAFVIFTRPQLSNYCFVLLRTACALFGVRSARAIRCGRPVGHAW